LVTALGLSLAMGDAAAQDNSNKYQQWPGAEGASGSERCQQIGPGHPEADRPGEKDKAPDPQFLDDLRGVLADYQNPWTTRLLYDDFSDGNYNGSTRLDRQRRRFQGQKRGLQRRV